MIETLLAFAWDLSKLLWNAVPRSLDKWRFRRFFGKQSISGEQVFAVVDPYSHPVPRAMGTGNRYVKRFLGTKPDQPLVGEDDVLGVNVVRVVAYVSAIFSRYRDKSKPISVVTDAEVMGKWDGTFICFGSSDSNIRTLEIESLPQQSFYTLGFTPNGFRDFRIGGRSYSISGSNDYGVLMRIRNPYHREHFLFVCAGLGEWGTSGSAYYLFDHWKDLYKGHGQEDFCRIIEVSIGSDESARDVFGIP